MGKLRHLLSLRFAYKFGQRRKDYFSWLLNYGVFWRHKKIKIRGTESLLDYKDVIEENTVFYLTPFPMTRFYGFEYTIENYSGVTRRVFADNEHGLNVGKKESTQKIETDAPLVFTLGQYRTTLLNKTGDYMICNIGPYIHYAHSILSQTEIDIFKRKFGKTLVVFPSHSIESTEWERVSGFDVFIEEYVKKHNIKTVIISMFFIDIQKGYHHVYEEKGYEIFCAGHRHNADFLDRQKALLKVADYVVSEGVGTHIGYCLAMNVPVQIYKNDNKLITSNSEEEIDYNLIENIASSFYDYSDRITEAQIEIGNYYFGLDSLKSREEMREIISFTNRVYYRAIIRNISYSESIKKELKRRSYSKQIYEMAHTNAYLETKN